MRNTAGLIPFRPGQSGNPGGRPKDIQGVTSLARKLCPKALRRLAEILDDPEPENSDKVRAAQVILDRGLGKVDVVVEEKPAVSFFQPFTEEQVQAGGADGPRSTRRRNSVDAKRGSEKRAGLARRNAVVLERFRSRLQARSCS